MKKISFPFILISLLLSCEKTPTPTEKENTVPESSVREALGQPQKLALGSEHSCALFTSGQVMCWGSSAATQLGEIKGKKIRSTVPHLLPYITDAIEIDSFADQTCVLRKNGEVVCFGTDGSKKEIRAVQGVNNATTIAVGKSTACASNKSDLWCWGKSKGGQIPGTFEMRTAKGVKLERNFEIMNGSESSFLAKGKSGWEGWGENKDNIFRTDAHVLNGFTKISKSELFVGMASREGVACGWTSNDVECWAEAMEGEDSILKPKGIIGAIEKVVLGNEFACALADKKIFCWGGNGQGTLGDGSRKSRAEAKAVEDLGDIIDIDAGAAHVCATTSEKTYCWGNSRSSQVGVDSRLVKTRPVELTFNGKIGEKY